MNNHLGGGTNAALAVILAFILTGALGFLTSTETTMETKTVYDRVADTTPFTTYSPVDSYEEYAAASNVTGWVDLEGTTIPFLENTASAYPYKFWNASDENTVSAPITQVAPIGNTRQNTFSWWPVHEVSAVGSEVGDEASSRGVTAERTSDGIKVRGSVDISGIVAPPSCLLSIYIAIEGPATSGMHGFTVNVMGSGGSPAFDALSISTREDFFAQASYSTSGRNSISIDVTAPLQEGERYYCAIQGWKSTTDTSLSGIALKATDEAGDTLWDRGLDSIQGGTTFAAGMDMVKVEYDEPDIDRVAFDLVVDGTAYDTSSDPWAVVPMSALYMQTNESGNWVRTYPPDGMTFKAVAPYIACIGSAEWTYSTVQEALTPLHCAELAYTLSSVGQDLTLVYHQDTDRWYVGKPSSNNRYFVPDLDGQSWGFGEIFLVAEGWRSAVQIVESHPVFTYKYVNPKAFVEIADGATGYWQNVNAVSEFGSDPYQNGKVVFLAERGTHVHSGEAYWKTAGGTVVQGVMDLDIPSSIPFALVQVTLDFVGGEFYCQGATPILGLDQADTVNNTIETYRYPLHPVFSQSGRLSWTFDASGTVAELSAGTSLVQCADEGCDADLSWGCVGESISMRVYMPSYGLTAIGAMDGDREWNGLTLSGGTYTGASGKTYMVSLKGHLEGGSKVYVYDGADTLLTGFDFLAVGEKGEYSDSGSGPMSSLYRPDAHIPTPPAGSTVDILFYCDDAFMEVEYRTSAGPGTFSPGTSYSSQTSGGLTFAGYNAEDGSQIRVTGTAMAGTVLRFVDWGEDFFAEYYFDDLPAATVVQDPSYICGMEFSKEGGTRVFVKATWVQLDPKAMLWGDPSVYLQHWFSDRFSEDAFPVPAGYGIRFQINAAVSYGDSLTLNGRTAAVSDGRISFRYISEGGEETDGTAILKGMALDFRGGRVTLVDTEGGGQSYDLGPYDQRAVQVVSDGNAVGTTYAAYTVSGTGTWYWQGNLYAIGETVEQKASLDLSKGLSNWGFDMTEAALVFLAMAGLCFGCIVYWRRRSGGDADAMDWIIISVTSILVLFGVVMI